MTTLTPPAPLNRDTLILANGERMPRTEFHRLTPKHVEFVNHLQTHTRSGEG